MAAKTAHALAAGHRRPFIVAAFNRTPGLRRPHENASVVIRSLTAVLCEAYYKHVCIPHVEKDISLSESPCVIPTVVYS